jgi:hypothetical protein
MAVDLGAAVVWYQSGRNRDGSADPRACWLSAEDARHVHELAESAGVRAVTDAYIAEPPAGADDEAADDAMRR